MIVSSDFSQRLPLRPAFASFSSRWPVRVERPNDVGNRLTATAPSGAAPGRRAGPATGPHGSRAPRSSATVRSESASARSRWWSTMMIDTSRRSLSKASNSSSVDRPATRPSNGSSSSSTRTSPVQRAGHRDHLLLAAGEIVGGRAQRSREAREELEDAVLVPVHAGAGAPLAGGPAPGSRPPSCRRRARAPAARSRRRGARFGGRAGRRCRRPPSLMRAGGRRGDADQRSSAASICRRRCGRAAPRSRARARRSDTSLRMWLLP